MAERDIRVRKTRQRGRKESSETVFGLFALWRAYRACRKGKRHTRDTQRYEASLLDQLVAARNRLARFIWQPSRTLSFVVASPKLREIHAAPFADRVVHHLLVDRLARIYEPVFIYDSYANRRGKGTHVAVERLQGFMRVSAIAGKPAPAKDVAVGVSAPITVDASINLIAAEAAPANSPASANAVFALQLDIANFFNSIHRPSLFRLIQRRLLRAVRRQGLAREEARALQAHVCALLSADPTLGVRRQGPPGLFEQVPPHKRLGAMGAATGLPIGNLTSQFFANVYLNELDQFVKHTLKARWYVRYVDDFVLLHADPWQLIAWRNEIEGFLEQHLSLQLRERAPPRPVQSGVNFLGYIVRPFYKLVRHVFAQLAAFERRHVRADERHFALRLPPAERDLLRARLASYLGHLRHAHSHRLWQMTVARFVWLERLFDFSTGSAAAPVRENNDKRWSRHTASRLRPVWEPAVVSGLAGQYRFFRNQFRGSQVLMQAGGCWLLTVEDPAAAARFARMAALSHDSAPRTLCPVPRYRPGLGQCLEIPAAQLASFRAQLKRRRIAHVLIAQTGHFRTGFKRRALRLIWEPGTTRQGTGECAAAPG